MINLSSNLIFLLAQNIFITTLIVDFPPYELPLSYGRILGVIYIFTLPKTSN